MLSASACPEKFAVKIFAVKFLAGTEEWDGGLGYSVEYASRWYETDVRGRTGRTDSECRSPRCWTPEGRGRRSEGYMMCMYLYVYICVALQCTGGVTMDDEGGVWCGV